MTTPWEILGLNEDAITDRSRVKRAYADALKRHRPDRDPEGFRRVREAYECLIGMIEGREHVEAPLEDREVSNLPREVVADSVTSVSSAVVPTWDERLQMALADDQATGDVSPLLRVVLAWLEDPECEANQRSNVHLVIRLSLRAPEVALRIAEAIPLRMQLEIPEVGFRIDLARQMKSIPDGLRPAVAAVVDGEEGAPLGEGSVRGARQVLYTLPKCMLGEVIRSRLNVVDHDRHAASEVVFNTRHREEMQRLQRRTHLPTFGLSGWRENLSVPMRGVLLLIVVAVLLWLKSVHTPAPTPVPAFTPEMREDMLRKIEAEQARRQAEKGGHPPRTIRPERRTVIEVGPVGGGPEAEASPELP